ncbi:hypothetical protein CHARACLAT_014742, partial [Characodon lateralis]|nr:hypothetical protein [Characodon lateralis]
MQSHLEYTLSLRDMICMSYRKMTEQELTLEEKMLALWDKFIPLLKQADSLLSQSIPPVANALDTMFSFLVCDLKNIVFKATSGPFLDPSQNANEMVSNLKYMCVHVQTLSTKLEELYSSSQRMQEQQLDLTTLAADVQKVTAREELWELKAECTAWMEEWNQLPLTEVVVSQAQEKIAVWENQTLSLTRIIPTGDLVLKEILGVLESLNYQVEILAQLKTSMLREKHWEIIFQGIGLLDVREKTVTVGHFMSGLMSKCHRELIHKICREAQMEWELEKGFQTICLRWKQRLFQLEEFAVPACSHCEAQNGLNKEMMLTESSLSTVQTTCQCSCNDARFTIIGLETHFAEIRKDLITLSIMLKSPHSVEFRLQLEDLVKSLKDLAKLLDLFERYQQMWAFLTKTFRKTSHYDQRLDLLKSFQQVDDAFKNIMHSVSKDLHVWNFVCSELDHKHDGHSLSKTLMDVQLAMNHGQQLSRLMDLPGVLETSFEWLSTMKYHINSEDEILECRDNPSCYVDVLNHHFQYGFEYYGPDDWLMVHTPSTEKATLGIVLALTRGSCENYGIQEITSFVRILRALLEHFVKELQKPNTILQKDKRGGTNHPSTNGQEEGELFTRNIFLVAYVWGFGGHLHSRHWPQFDLLARQVLFASRYKIQVPDQDSLFQHFIDNNSKRSPSETHLTDFITPKFWAYRHLLNLMLEANQPVLLAGEPCSGKTTLSNRLLGFDQPYINLAASQLLSSRDLRIILKSICTQRNCKDNVCSTKKQPSLLLFVDDLHETPCDVFGKASTALETLRQSMSKGEVLTFDSYVFESLGSGAKACSVLYREENLSSHVFRVTSLKDSRQYLMDNWINEKSLVGDYKNVHVFLLMPFTKIVNSEIPANKETQGWSAQMAKALKLSCCVEVYQPWSSQSLAELAIQCLRMCPYEMTKVCSEDSLSVAMSGIHQSACQHASLCLKSQPFSPPTYLEFIACFGFLCNKLYNCWQSKHDRIATTLTRLDVVNNRSELCKVHLKQLQQQIDETRQLDKELLGVLEENKIQHETALERCAAGESKLNYLEEQIAQSENL